MNKNIGNGVLHNCKPVNKLPVGVKSGAVPVSQTRTVPINTGPSFWETDIQVVRSCGVLDQEILLSITPKARGKINLLMERFPNIEWLAYLVGNKETNTVEDIVIPKQRVTTVNVYVDGTVDVPTMGVIHSHHDMGNNFSHTDNEYINQNHDISLCISKHGISGQARVKTECGRYALVPVNVVDRVVGFDAVDFLKEVDEKITEQTINYGRVHTHKNSPLVSGLELSPDFFDDDYDNISEITIGKGYNDNRCLLEEVKLYQDSIKDIVVDAFYKVEFESLTNIIDSIGSPNFSVVLNNAYSNRDNVFTDDYYRLIDEISLWGDELTGNERVTLVGLSAKLHKMLEVENVH